MAAAEDAARLRDALSSAEQIAPCVLWIDELEKGLAASGSSEDGGVSRRVLQVAELLPSVAGPDTSQAALQAGQQLPIKVLVSTGERRVVGYTLELFYP